MTRDHQAKPSRSQTQGILKWLRPIGLSASALLVLPLSTAGAFTPDTLGYLEFHPIRQPLYGMWANALHALLGTWQLVGVAQAAFLCAPLAYFYYECEAWGRAGRVLALAAAATTTVLLKIGTASLVTAILSEALFVPLLTLLAALTLRLCRTSRPLPTSIVSLLVLFLLTQVRPIALPSLILPLMVAIVWIRSSERPPSTRQIRTLATAFTIMLTVGPVAFGKKPLQLGTPGDFLAFALLPRIGQLRNPPNQGIPTKWQEMSLGLGKR